MSGISAPRGTKDILPGEVEKWQYMEDIVRRVCAGYGYREIRTPLFEHTELFQRGIGEATDIVEKEMYTFTDRGGRSITLRPEGTAPVVRAYLEHKLYGSAQPVRLFYLGPMFRYERPQAGRYRQFHQFGVEALGSQDPLMDTETILVALTIFEELGLENLHIELNSMGCPQCRPRYREGLKDYLKGRLDGLCSVCQTRYELNPVRILDCKEDACRKELEGVPEIGDYLCPECRGHFELVQRYLTSLGRSFSLNPRLVRGLDYYTKTVFEVIAPGMGAQNAVAGGGRYDGLAEECGGRETPAVGFAAGMERLLLALESQGKELPLPRELDAFVAVVGDSARTMGLKVAVALRQRGFKAAMETEGRSLRAQLKAADRLLVKHVVIIGEEELGRSAAIIRNMEDGGQQEVPLEQLLEAPERLLLQKISD
ncbi:MAG: histidine--tRNA ligase [Firmicutes bacterium]|jgi:histidyl-tRNA synthetase|nr:histidine--tRNA ligase [Bacillota bacterium]